MFKYCSTRLAGFCGAICALLLFGQGYRAKAQPKTVLATNAYAYGIARTALPAAVPVGTVEAAHIRNLIQQLAKVEKPNFGTSYFAPLAGREYVNRTEYNDTPSVDCAQFTELVRLGPRALPFLLDSLSDSTETKEVINPGQTLMWMMNEHHVPGNPMNVREKAVLDQLAKRVDTVPVSPHYVMTVGDACYDILGQIVGRRYIAVRGQPTGGMIVVSPSHDPTIAKALRTIWSSGDPRRRVLDSLLLDYASPDPWIGPSLEPMLYYFPRETGSLVAAKLMETEKKSEAQRVKTPPDEAGIADYRFVNMIRSISWCKNTAIRDTLRSIYRRSDEPGILAVCLPAFDPVRDWPVIESRIIPNLRLNGPDSELIWQNDAMDALVALYRFNAKKSLSVFKACLKNAGPIRAIFVCLALESTRGEWDRALLLPLLSDKRSMFSAKYRRANASPGVSFTDDRVCDNAARSICAHRHDLKFAMHGSTSDCDNQIRRIRIAFASADRPATK